MLQMVSWKEYFTLIGLGLVVYYGYVTVRYFPLEIRKFGQLKRKPAGEEEYELEEGEPAQEESIPKIGKEGGKVANLILSGTNGSIRMDDQEIPSKEIGREKKESDPEEMGFGEENQSFLVIGRELSEAIRILVKDAAGKRMIREELIMALQLLLRKDRYQLLRTNSVFVDSINNLILFDVEHNCSIQLDADELKGLWVR